MAICSKPTYRHQPARRYLDHFPVARAMTQPTRQLPFDPAAPLAMTFLDAQL